MDRQLTSALVTLTADSTARRVFQRVAKDRRVRRMDLLARLVEEDGGDLNSIQEHLDELQKSNLIGTIEGPAKIEDLKTYYLTADGLSVERKLRELGLEIAV